MIYETKEIQLKNGKAALFRSPEVDDAAEMLDYMKTTARETHFLLRAPEECTATVEQEEKFLRGILESEHDTMIVCQVDGKIAGNCQLSRKRRLRNDHRATIGIALIREYWGLGIGTQMFHELIRLAREQGIEQLELEVIEGNERALRLYQKMGFRIVGEIPNAIRLSDGTRLTEYSMVKELVR